MHHNLVLVLLIVRTEATWIAGKFYFLWYILVSQDFEICLLIYTFTRKVPNSRSALIYEPKASKLCTFGMLSLLLTRQQDCNF